MGINVRTTPLVPCLQTGYGLYIIDGCDTYNGAPSKLILVIKVHYIEFAKMGLNLRKRV